MSPFAQTPIPPMDEFGLPAPAWVFQALIIVTMLLHFLFMNFVLGGALIAFALDVSTLLGMGNHNLVVRIIWQVLPVALSLAITTGVAPLLFVQVLFGHFFYPANVFLGFTWFALVPILIVAFYIVYFLVYRLGNVLTGHLGRWNRSPGRRLPLAIASAALFLCVAWILTSNHMLSLQPDAWAGQGQWQQNRLAVTPGITVPRLLHTVGGSIAVAGVWIAAIGGWRRRRGVDPPPIATAITKTGLWTAVPTIAAAAVLGPVFLVLLPPEVRGSLFRPGVFAALWWIGLAGVAAQLVLGVMAIRRPAEFRWLAGLTACVLVTLVGMLSAREQVRLAYLAREGVGFAPVDWAVHPQVSSLILFLALFVVAIATVVWLVRVSIRPPAATPPIP